MSLLKEENEQTDGEVKSGTTGTENLTTGAGPVQTGPTTGSGAPMGQQPSYQPQQRGSGRFTNIKKYIEANKPAGRQYADRIKQEGKESASKVREGIQASQSRFSQEVAEEDEQGQLVGGQLYQGIQSGREAADTAYYGRPIEEQTAQPETPIAPGQPQAQAAIQPETQPSPDDINRFTLSEDERSAWDRLYGGDLQRDISDVDIFDYTQPVQSQAQELQEMAQQAGTEEGRFGLLRQTFARPGQKYTKGQQRLDELFLQGTSAGGQLGQDLGQIASQVGQETTALGQELEDRKTALAEMAGITREEAETLLLQGEDLKGFQGEQFGGGIEDIGSGLGARLEEMRTNVLGTEDTPGELERLRRSLEHNQMFEDIQDNPIYEQLEKIVGPSGQIYNLNLADYITGEDDVKSRLEMASPEQLATQQEFQRFQNISDLLGKQGMAISEQDIGKFSPYELKQIEGADMTQLEEALGKKKEAVQSSKQQFADRVSSAYDQYVDLMNRRAQSDEFETREDARVMARQMKYGFNQLKQAVDAWKASGDETHLNEAKNIYSQLMRGPAQTYTEQAMWEPYVDRILQRQGYQSGRAMRTYLDPQRAGINAANEQLRQLDEKRRLFASDDTTPYDKLAGIYDPTNIVDDSILKGKG